MGHSGFLEDSHWSMHSMWKRCRQGSTLNLSPSLLSQALVWDPSYSPVSVWATHMTLFSSKSSAWTRIWNDYFSTSFVIIWNELRIFLCLKFHVQPGAESSKPLPDIACQEPVCDIRTCSLQCRWCRSSGCRRPWFPNCCYCYRCHSHCLLTQPQLQQANGQKFPILMLQLCQRQQGNTREELSGLRVEELLEKARSHPQEAASKVKAVLITFASDRSHEEELILEYS